MDGYVQRLARQRQVLAISSWSRLVSFGLVCYELDLRQSSGKWKEAVQQGKIRSWEASAQAMAMYLLRGAGVSDPRT